MKTFTKIAVAAGIAGLVSAGALAITANAHPDGRGYGGHGYHGGWGKHGGWGHHRGWRKRYGGWSKHYGGRYGKRLLKRYDANKDGKITQEEIDTNRTDWHKKFDTDGDGKLTIKEFEALWVEAMRRRMVRMYQRLDEDGNAAITLEEYVEPMARFVERHDRNGDGALSREDRKHRYHHRDRHRGGKQQMAPEQQDGDTSNQ